MPEFTREDRNLLVRVGKVLKSDLVSVERLLGDSTLAPADRHDTKALRDRLLRDARDLEGLRKRLEAAHPQALQAPGTIEDPAGG